MVIGADSALRRSTVLLWQESHGFRGRQTSLARVRYRRIRTHLYDWFLPSVEATCFQKEARMDVPSANRLTSE